MKKIITLLVFLGLITAGSTINSQPTSVEGLAVGFAVLSLPFISSKPDHARVLALCSMFGAIFGVVAIAEDKVNDTEEKGIPRRVSMVLPTAICCMGLYYGVSTALYGKQ